MSDDISTFHRMARHSCQRDVKEIFRTNEILFEEYKQISQPVETPRKKRAIALIGAGLLGIETLANAFGMVSPIASMGRGIAHALGIATYSDIKITRDELEKHAEALNNLTINQRQLIEAYQLVTDDMHTLVQARNKSEHEIAVLFVDFDSKINVYRLQSIIQDTIIKMATAVQAAKNMQTSPFVFGQEDLRNLTTRFRMNHIPLTANIDEVLTSVVLVDNRYTFIFSVPIINTINNFHIYEVKALPLFKEGKGYDVLFEHKYIAVNTATREYFTTSETEYNYCTRYPLCTVSEPFRIISDDSPCEVRSLRHKVNDCPIKLNENAQPSFLSNRNITYFSVPKPMEIHLICTHSGKTFSEQKLIDDYGSFTIPDGCEVKINNEISFRPGFVASVHSLAQNSMFEILNIPNELHEFPTTEAPIATNTFIPSFRNVEHLSESFELLFDSDTTYGEIIRITIYVLIILAIFGILYCACTKFRLWFNGCCFLTKPTVYWRKVHGYQVPEYNRRKKPDNPANSPLNEQEQKRTAFQFSSLTTRMRNLTDEINFFRRDPPETTFYTGVEQPSPDKSDQLDRISVLPIPPAMPPINFRSYKNDQPSVHYPTLP